MYECGSSPVAASGCAYLDLPGRLVNFGSIMGVSDKSSGHGTRSLDESRAEHVAAETADNFSGSGLKFLCNVGTPVFRTCSVISGLPESVQTRATGPCRFVLKTAGSYGSSIPSGSAGPDSHKAIPVVDQWPRGLSTLASLPQHQGYAQRLLYLASVDKSWFLSRGVQLGGVCRYKTIMTDASLMGWGAAYHGRPAFGV